MRFDIHPFKDPDEARAWSREQIDTAAGAARARYLTVAAGQDATYSAKYADAQAFARAGYPANQVGLYPWVSQEAIATGVLPRAAADDIMANGDPWNNIIGPRIEGLRIGGKKALTNLASIAEIVSHTAKVRADLATT